MKVHKTISLDAELFSDIFDLGREEGVPHEEVFSYFIQAGLARIKEFRVRALGQTIQDYEHEQVVRT